MPLPILYKPPGSVALPDNKLWENRFQIRSATSNRIYIIAQNIQKRHWGCSCMAWKRFRYCKHLEALGLPGNEKPHEIQLPKT